LTAAVHDCQPASGAWKARHVRRHRPIATTLIVVAILLVGLVAFPSLPVAPLAQVDFPTITVSTSLPDRRAGKPSKPEPDGRADTANWT
jgi:hypothetical protein